MDNLFHVRRLTAAVNELRVPGMKVTDRLFRGKENLQPTDKLAFDVITDRKKY